MSPAKSYEIVLETRQWSTREPDAERRAVDEKRQLRDTHRARHGALVEGSHGLMVCG